MSDLAGRFAYEAEQLEGAPFRLHGRDPSTGLDCVGLVACALQNAGVPCEAPAGYTLRNLSIAGLVGSAEAAGFRDARGHVCRGDLVLVKPGPAQHHLCIATSPSRFIHAHAGIGRVVAHEGLIDWPVQRHWRLLQS